MPNTMRRHAGAVALYTCTMARGAPCKASTVRAIRSSRDWVMTMICTSSGIRFWSMSLRTKSKSICDAAGKPTSISLNPMRTSSLNSISLRSAFMGSNSDWLPSRRSVDNQMGAWVMLRDGHWRSGKLTGAVGRYLAAGLVIIMISRLHETICWQHTRRLGALRGELKNSKTCHPLQRFAKCKGWFVSRGSGGGVVSR